MKISWKCHASPETSLFRPHPSRISGWSRGRKWVKNVMRPLETSLTRPHHSRTWGFSRRRKWLLSAIRPFESSLYRLEKVTFSVGQEEGNDFKVTFDNLNHRFFRLHSNRWAHCSRPEAGAEHKILPGARILNMPSTVWKVELPTHRRTWNVSECDPSIKLGSGLLEIYIFWKNNKKN